MSNDEPAVLDARPRRDDREPSPGVPESEAPGPGMIWIPGGTFRMGSDDHYPEESPTHQVGVDGFWMDAHTVTNAEFSRFVKQTRYVTSAERAPDPADYPGAVPELLVAASAVFRQPTRPVSLDNPYNWWTYVPGASWRQPQGPGSSVKRLPDHPVVHVAWEDVAAYAEWAGKELPTEAEWEYAARGGLDGTAYTWGEDARPEGKVMANTWDGPDFPWRSSGESGFLRTAPVGSFPANGYGLFDMAGNVWEWTDDWWTSRHPDAAGSPCCAPANPRGGEVESSYDPAQPQFRVGRKVVKGGSHLCADSYCLRYRPGARRPQAIDTGMSHVGFRIVHAAVAPA